MIEIMHFTNLKYISQVFNFRMSSHLFKFNSTTSYAKVFFLIDICKSIEDISQVFNINLQHFCQVHPQVMKTHHFMPKNSIQYWPSKWKSISIRLA